MALTAKQQAFVNAYLIHRNATRAAIDAGYSEKTAHAMGWENLRKPEIKSVIEQRFAEEAMSANEVIIRLADQARGDMADVAGIESAADLKVSPYSRLVKEFERKIEFDREGGRTETIKLKLYDAQAALVHLLKEAHLKAGEPTERSEIVDNSLTDDERAARVAALLERARARRDGRAADGDGRPDD